MFKQSLLAASMLAAASSTAWANTVTGTVTDEQGRPVAGATVSVEGSRKTVTTDENGRYTLTNVPAADVHIHVASEAYLHGDKDLGPITGNPQVDFVLTPASVENILVTATAMQASVLESVTPVSVLGADALRKAQAPTLGETLKNTPGVHSTYFGPVASSPVIRGNDGPRVKIVQNGLDVSDVSRVGPDHNVAASAATATQIEVLRGPATLLYGSGAIGGVVNVVDQRIPKQVPRQLEGEAEVRYSTVDNGKFGKLDVTGGQGPWAYHVDGFARDTQDVDIPGFASAQPDEDEPYGTLENSDMETTNFTAGLSYVQDEGFLGFSVAKLDNTYGVAGHHHHDSHAGHDEDHDEHDTHDEEHDEHEAHEAVGDADTRIDVDMTRFQLAGELHSPLPGLNNIKLGLAHTDYEHVELEGEAVGTRFSNQSTNMRLTANHIKVAGWHGVIGFQGSTSDYQAIGAEAFTPSTESDSAALFIVEQKQFDEVTVELGGRVEHTQHNPASTVLNLETGAHHEEGHHEEGHHEEDPHADNHDDEELQRFDFDAYDFTAVSLSAGANWEYQPGYSMAIAASRNERAPSLQELFAGGQHLATQTYEVGLVFDLDEDGELADTLGGVSKEVSNNLDLTFRKFTGDWGYTVSFFYNQVDNYIFQRDSGLMALEGEHEEHEEHDEHASHNEHDEHDMHEEHEGEEEGLPVLVFQQADADIYGVEAQAYVNLDSHWRVDVFGDVIRAQLENQDLPRTPPLRVGATLSYQADQLSGELGATYYDNQDLIAPFETATDSYTLVNAKVEYELAGPGGRWVVFAHGDNLFDQEARVHTSFLKDRAPLPGRNLTVGARLLF